MSTDYSLLKRVPMCDLFDGRLEEFNVREHVKSDETTETSKCLTDGRNYLWVYADDDGFVYSLTRYCFNVPSKILNAVANVFDVDIVSEYEPQYWGFDTQEEWDTALEEKAKEDEKRFYIELLKYLQGQPNDIRPGTSGMREAEIAKKLVEKDPTLLLPVNKDKLRNGIKSICDPDNAVMVTPSPQKRALVQMLSTHEDDLPRA